MFTQAGFTSGRPASVLQTKCQYSSSLHCCTAIAPRPHSALALQQADAHASSPCTSSSNSPSAYGIFLLSLLRNAERRLQGCGLLQCTLHLHQCCTRLHLLRQHVWVYKGSNTYHLSSAPGLRILVDRAAAYIRGHTQRPPTPHTLSELGMQASGIIIPPQPNCTTPAIRNCKSSAIQEHLLN